MITERKRQLLKQQSPEILQALLIDALDFIDHQKAIITQIEKENAEKAQSQFALDERLRLLQKRIFGRSKESRLEVSDRDRDQSQEDAQLFSQAAFPAPEDRKGAKAQIEERVIEQEASAEDLECESAVRGFEKPSSSQWEKLDGVYDQCTKIQIIERRYVKEIHRRAKYKLKAEFNTSDKDVIVTAKGVSGLLPGMSYTTEFVASVVSDKYIYHLPLERQTRAMEALGLRGMRTSTLSRLCGLAASGLEVVQEQIREELLASDLALHLDETPWRVQNKEQKDGYMWIVSNCYGSYYFFRPTRSGEVIRSVLGNYSGPVVTDGFSGYNALDEKVVQSYCYAHARRNFIELESHDPSVKVILDEMDELFTIERRAKTFEDLKKLREQESTVVIGRLKSHLYEELPKSRESSQKRKAIEYMLKRWIGFTNFLKDSRVPLTNNEAERTIRHAVMGRKNFYGSNNHNGANTAATIYTIVESCKKNDLDPKSYLTMALKAIAEQQVPPTPLAYAREKRQ